MIHPGMIIALTGTPGTGKSSVCRLLSKKYRVIDLNALVIREKLHCGVDSERDTLIADTDALEKRIWALVGTEASDVILEGHLSHHLSIPDVIIVLRASPSELELRLRSRGYNESKIRENVEAEMLDVILVESVDSSEKVYEIDTTGMPVNDVAGKVDEIIQAVKKQDGDFLASFKPGKTDFLSAGL